MKKPIIKESDLFALCAELNTLSGRPQFDKTKNAPGTYHIDMGYGAYRLLENLSTGGTTPHGPNYGTKREVYDFLARSIRKLEG